MQEADFIRVGSLAQVLQLYLMRSFRICQNSV